MWCLGRGACRLTCRGVLQAIWTRDTVYFFMDFSLMYMPVIAVGLTCIVLAVHLIACTLSVCKRRLLMDAERAREIVEEGPSSLRPSPQAPELREPLIAGKTSST